MTISENKASNIQCESKTSSLKQSTLTFNQTKCSASGNINKSNDKMLKKSNDSEKVIEKLGNRKDVTIEKAELLNNDTFIKPKKALNVNSPRSQSCRPKGSKLQKSREISASNYNLFDLWPTIRRSGRCTEQVIKEQKEKRIMENIIKRKEEGLRIVNTIDKGRGIESTVPFNKESFIVEYAGDLLSEKKAIARNAEYEKDPSKGSYMYHFKYNNAKFCVDATSESGRLGRLLNHSKLRPNCYVKIIAMDNVPRLAIFAKRDIEIGEELTYDYGDRDKATIDANPWLKY